jgi:LAS superfamily LD-carboxypeptidase LdcB
MSNLISAAEAATGSQVQITSGYRTPEHQAQIYANYTQKPVTYGGKTYQPNGTSGIAARPGSSEHQSGTALDMTRRISS